MKRYLALHVTAVSPAVRLLAEHQGLFDRVFVGAYVDSVDGIFPAAHVRHLSLETRQYTLRPLLELLPGDGATLLAHDRVKVQTVEELLRVDAVAALREAACVGVGPRKRPRRRYAESAFWIDNARLTERPWREIVPDGTWNVSQLPDALFDDKDLASI